MGDRVILCGSVKVSKAAFEKAQRRAILKLCFLVESEEGPPDVEMRGLKPEALFSEADPAYASLATNAYDTNTHRWVFGCSLHDDDWSECDKKTLEKALVAAKDQGGVDVVFAFNLWEDQLDRAWLIVKGACTKIEVLPAVPRAVAKLIRAGRYAKAIEKMQPLIVEASTWTADDA